MRRPTFCSAFEEETKNTAMPSSSTSSDKESRLSKVKRIITGTILLGRKTKKESLLRQEETHFQENTQSFYENDEIELRGIQKAKVNTDDKKEPFRKCKKGIKSKSSKNLIHNDENMDTENIPTKNKNEISIFLSKENSGKKVKEICIEISQSQPSATTEIVLKPRKRKERLDSGGSIKHENKVIRSNSEERHEDKGDDSNDNIRRVSSHEDFSRVRKNVAKPLHEVNSCQQETSPLTIMNTVESENENKEGIENDKRMRNKIDLKHMNSDDGILKENVEFKIEDVFMNACPEEIEHERRRSCERFARAVATPRGRRNLPRKRTKGHKTVMKPKEESDTDQTSADEFSTNKIVNADQVDEKKEANKGIEKQKLDTLEVKDRSPSPDPSSSPPALDVSSLHRQMEGSEPITSRGKIISPEDEAESPTLEALISPRNSLVMRLAYLDPSMPPSPPRDHNIRQNDVDPQERKINKQINSIKKKLKRYEDGFQEEFGYRPSQADKLANKDIKKMCGELSKLRSQLKQMKEENAVVKSIMVTSTNKQLSFLTSLEGQANTSPNNGVKVHPKTNKTMEEVLQDVEKRLQEKRQQSGRSSEIVEMNRGELLEEKLSVQKALLHLENVFGRPVTREDRDLVRPLYQRYRTLKRMVIRSTAAKLNNSTGELATILEHETMDFTASPSTSFDFGDGTSSAPEGLNMTLSENNMKSEAPSEVPKKLLEVPVIDELQNSSSSSESLGENLHALPLSQLLEQQTNAREEKKKLRRSLRDFEEKFQNETGRRAQKQDRIAMEGIYINYKQIKAKLRLLDALVAKKSCYKRNSC